MPQTLHRHEKGQPAGLRAPVGDKGTGATSHIRIGHGSDGIERLEARFVGPAFSLHRHDTYAIGVTLSGVQTFHYRGERRLCLPGQGHILHPDETHDGGPATAEGFGYRIVYVDPALIQQALGGRPLPFVADPVIDANVFEHALPPALWRLEDPIDDVAQVDLTAAMADMLVTAAARTSPAKGGSLRLASLLSIRDLITALPAAPLSLEALETVSGLDRWSLARQFRAAFGTSPSSFRTMRQLDQVRRLIRDGQPLATAALAAGFADQSHMSRMFKRAYGLTPARWAAAVANR
ncbi:MAG TPA: AraC family transcriptional regulator [Vineibacter sp.]|nr:AraC family transcriptional regulator [Vineibacter sp.]